MTSVDVNDLTTAARRVSTAVLPPIAHLATAAASALFILGYDAIVHVISFDASDLIPSEAAVKALQLYGVAALTPLVVAVLILVTAHGVQSGLTWLGSRLPPHLGSNTTIQMHAAADEWTLRRLWVLNPEFDPINGLNMFNVATDEAVAQAEADAKAHHRLRQTVILRDRATHHRAQMRFTKGMIVFLIPSCALAVFTDGGLRPIGRLSLVIALFAAWAFYQGVRLIESEHAYFRAKIQTYLDVQESLRGKPLEPQATDIARDGARIRELQMFLSGTPAWMVSWRQDESDIRARRQLLIAIARFIRRVPQQPPSVDR